MTRACPDKRCYVPDTQCRLGEDTPATCVIWKQNSAAISAEAIPGDSDGTVTLLPWSGSAMGLQDLSFLSGRGEPRVVGIVGAHNAGKSTLLGAWYQQIGRDGTVAAGRFAGSFSLEGWEAVAYGLRWEGGRPHFPPHTSSGAGRAPGMLHLALRDDHMSLSDQLFADAPGEWFERWAVDSAANDAEGARWLILHSTVLVVVADCEALAGVARGSNRAALIQLLRRTAAERKGRPVALVWSKADVAISAAMRTAVRDAAQLVMPDIVEFYASIADFSVDGVSHDARASLAAILEWTLQPIARGFVLPAPPIPSSDSFFHYGAQH